MKRFVCNPGISFRQNRSLFDLKRGETPKQGRAECSITPALLLLWVSRYTPTPKSKSEKGNRMSKLVAKDRHDSVPIKSESISSLLVVLVPYPGQFH